MSSKREQVIEAVKALLTAVFPDGVVTRNEDKPEDIAPGGTFNVRDGSAEIELAYLSPATWDVQHRVAVDIGAYRSLKPRWEVLDDILVQIGQAIAADRTLGGLCEWVIGDPPAPDDAEAEGAETFRFVELGIVCSYTTTDPLL